MNPQVGSWTTGLCDCCSDPKVCLKTCFCPCVTFGQNAETIDMNTGCCPAGACWCFLAYYGFSCFYSYKFRRQLRNQYSLPEEPCGDFCIHWFCHNCAICQEQRELKNRGLDPTSGKRRAEKPVPEK